MNVCCIYDLFMAFIKSLPILVTVINKGPPTVRYSEAEAIVLAKPKILFTLE